MPQDRAAIVAEAHEVRPPRTALSEDEVEATHPYKIIAQFKTPKDICISVLGDYWERLPELRGRRIYGTIMQFSKKQKPDRSVKVRWEDGWETEHLDQLFHPEVELQFEPYEDGRPAPRLTGRAAAREARAEAHQGPAETFVVEYEEGSVSKQQVWTVEKPDAITVDQRAGDGHEWQKPKINRSLSSVNTPFKMWVNATLPMNLVSKMVTYFNQRLSGHVPEGSKRPSEWHRKTSMGEIIRFLSYMGALAVERGDPIEDRHVAPR